jgi:hypothetical protein
VWHFSPQGSNIFGASFTPDDDVEGISPGSEWGARQSTPVSRLEMMPKVMTFDTFGICKGASITVKMGIRRHHSKCTK